MTARATSLGLALSARGLALGRRHRLALRDRPILVTGATGLIGRPLVRALSECGAEPWAVVRPGREHAVPAGVRVVVWDLQEDRPRTPLPREIGALVHLAAPRDRWSSEFARFAPHVKLTVDAAARLFEAAHARGARHLIAVSTIAVHGPHGRLLAPAVGARFEDASPHPYAVTKRWAEELAAHARAHVRHVTIVRPGPVYGPGQSSSGLLQGFVGRLRRGEPIRLAPPRGRVVSPVFVGDVVHVLVSSLARPGNDLFTVGGPDALRERTLVEDLARWLALRPRLIADRSLGAANFATDHSVVDGRFPARPRTPWKVGMCLTWTGRGF